MREYPVTQGELWGLGSVGAFAALAFSSAAGLFGFSIDTAKDLDLSNGVAAHTAAYWTSMRDMAFNLSIGAAVIGVLLVFAGAAKIISIVKNTTFPEDQ